MVIAIANFWEAVFPQYLAAIGTISAVIVSLYLAQRGFKHRFHATAAIVQFASNAGPVAVPTSLKITIINHSQNPILLSGLIWHNRSIFKKTRYFQVHDYENPFGDKLPKTLLIGDSCNLFLPEATFIKNLKEFAYNRVKLYFTTVDDKLLRVQIHKKDRKKARRLTGKKLL